MAALSALFIRSLRDDMRSKALLWTRTGLAIAVLFAVFKARVFRFGTASGLDFFETLVWMNAVFIVVAGLSYFASAITEEKEEGTLGLLRMTDLSPLSILLGKSTSRFVGGALMLLVQFPFALLAITLGGVHISQVTGSYALLVALLFFACNAGLLASVISRRGGVAGVWSGIFMAAWAGTRFPGEFDRLLSVAGTQSSIRVPCLWLICGGLLAFVLSLALFNRFCTEAGEGAPSRPARKKAGGGATATGNPRRASGDAIAWRDFHFFHGGTRAVWIKSVLYLLGAAWLLAETMGSSIRSYPILYVWALVVIGIESAFAASRIYRIERKDRTLSSLVILPRTLDEVIRAKRRAVVRSLAPALTALGISAVVAIPGVLSDVSSPEFAVLVFFWMPQAAAFIIAQFYFNLRLVAWFSLRMKWGGLPTALALSWVANSIAGFFAMMMFQQAGLIVLIVATVIASKMMKKALRFRIWEAAAEE